MYLRNGCILIIALVFLVACQPVVDREAYCEWLNAMVHARQVMIDLDKEVQGARTKEAISNIYGEYEQRFRRIDEAMNRNINEINAVDEDVSVLMEAHSTYTSKKIAALTAVKVADSSSQSLEKLKELVSQSAGETTRAVGGLNSSPKCEKQ